MLSAMKLLYEPDSTVAWLEDNAGRRVRLDDLTYVTVTDVAPGHQSILLEILATTGLLGEVSSTI